jgi:hypothetical protein
MVRRAAALVPLAALLAAALVGCATQADPARQTQTAEAARQADALERVNGLFRAAYAEARAGEILRADPTLVVQFDDLHLIRGGAVRTDTFTPRVYHEYKAISHIPLAVYVVVAPGAGQPLAESARRRLAELRAAADAAGKALPGRPNWPAAEIERHGRIVALALAFIDKAVAAGTVSAAEVTAFARAQRPLVMASADSAARLQLDGLHALVGRWRAEMGEAAWRRAYVVVLGPRQPRVGNLQYVYFVRALGPGAEGKRLFYAEGTFDRDGGQRLLGTILLDRGASVAFFADPVRLERDLLADGAARHLNRLFPRR